MKLHGKYNSQNSTGYINKRSLTSVAISSQTYFGNMSAKRVSRSSSKTLQVSDVQRKVQNAFVTFVSDFVVMKTCHSNLKITLLSDCAIGCQSGD